MSDNVIDKLSIEIEASAKSTSAVFSQLQSQISTLQSAINSIDMSKISKINKTSKNLGIDTSGMTKAERDVSNSIDKIKQSLAGLNSYKNAALGGDSSSLTSFNRRVISIQSSIDTLGEKLQQLGNNRIGVNIDTDRFQSFRTELADIQATLNNTKLEVDTSGTSSGLSDISDKAKEAAGNLLSMTASGIKSGFRSLKSTLSSIKDTISNIGSKASSTASSGFSKILKYGFGIRSLYVLFRRLRTAIKDSFTELQNSGAYYETTKANIEALKSSLTTLKYQFGAAFEPIFNTVAPALQTLINYLVAVMNTISAFIAKLTGKSTYSKAVAATAEIASNTGSAAGSAAELNKQLQGFDERNNLDLDSGSSGGSGGGSSGDSSSVTYVEESVESALGNLTNTLIDQIKAGDWEGVGNTLSTKITEALNGIDWTSIKSKASTFGTNIASFFNGFITTDLFSSLGTTLAESINTAFSFLNSFGTTFDWTNFGTSIGTGLSSFFKNADLGSWGATVHTWVAGILDAGIALLQNTDFEEIGSKLAAFLNGLDVADIASKLLTFAKLLISGIAKAIESLWDDSDAQTKLGLAILGLIGVSKLTGLGSTLASLISSAIPSTIPISSPINLSFLGKVALVAGTAALAWEGGKSLSQWIAGKLSGTQGISAKAVDDYIEISQTYTLKMYLEEITSAAEDGNLWDAWSNMVNDWYEPVYEEIDQAIEDNSKKTKQKDANGNTVQTGTDWNNYTHNASTSKTGYKSSRTFTTKLKTQLEGATKTKDDIDKLKQSFNDLTTESSKNTDAEYTTKVGGEISSIDDLSTWKQKFTSLRNSWSGKDAKMTTSEDGIANGKVSGWIEKLKDLGTKWSDIKPDSKFGTSEDGLANNKVQGWLNQLKGHATTWSNTKPEAKFKTSESGLSNFDGKQGYKSRLDNLVDAWSKANRTATFTTNLSGNLDSSDKLNTAATAVSTLSNSFTGNKSASYSVTYSGPSGDDLASTAGGVSAINSSFANSSSQSLEYTLTAGVDMDSVNKATAKITNEIKKGFTGTFKVQASNADGGIISSKGIKTKIPQYAGGTLDALSHGSLFVAGERGPEVMGHINGKTEILNRSQIASVMHSAFVSAMSDFRQMELTTPQQLMSDYSHYVANTANGDFGGKGNNTALIEEQNRLLREQNQLLTELLDKPTGISSRDVFNATRSEAQNYYKRTGNSPFVM